MVLVSGWILFHFEFIVVFFRGDNDRDVFNEKPSKEELVSATQVRYCNGDYQC